MNFLWNMNEISVKGIHFEGREIRERIIYEMSCEDLDRAIAEAISLKWKIKFTDFITLIFEHILFGERIVELQIEKTHNVNVAYRGVLKCYSMVKSKNRVKIIFPYIIGYLILVCVRRNLRSIFIL